MGRAKKRPPKPRTIEERLRAAVAAFPRRVGAHRDPPGSVVIEVTPESVSEAERAHAIRLHKRLVHFEAVSRRILANPETTPGRRWRAEILLRETLDARARWETIGERPDARMGTSSGSPGCSTP